MQRGSSTARAPAARTSRATTRTRTPTSARTSGASARRPGRKAEKASVPLREAIQRSRFGYGRFPMAIATQGSSANYLQRAPSPSGLADVVDLILDKGLVIDAFVRIAVIGIELVTIDARIVIASVDTYLRFAEAVNRVDLTQTEAAGLAELRDGGGSDKGKGMAEGAKKAFSGNVK